MPHRTRLLTAAQNKNLAEQSGIANALHEQLKHMETQLQTEEASCVPSLSSHLLQR